MLACGDGVDAANIYTVLFISIPLCVYLSQGCLELYAIDNFSQRLYYVTNKIRKYKIKEKPNK